MQKIKMAISMIMAFFTLLPQLVAPITPMFNEIEYFEDWSPEQKFTKDYAIVLEKDPNKDFVVLNITDIQMKDEDYYMGMGEESEAMITRLVEEQKPDLITVTGDNAWGPLAYVNLANFMDSFDIPWAPVMGNHDGENTIGEFWCAYHFYKAKNCLWKFGPKDMGYGNYIINVEENGKTVHTFFMMDTHSNAEFTDADGNKVSGYDHLWDNQIAWYEWAVKGIAALEGKTVESSALMHIPVYEFEQVYHSNYDLETDKYTGEYAEGSFGVNHEKPCPAPVNNGFVDKALELGSTKNMIFGHEHYNNASFLYKGIRLTYGLKLGKGCYYEAALQGGTTLTINSAGSATIQHINYGA